jgi:hypothetical protein
LAHHYSSNYKQCIHCDQWRKIIDFVSVQGIANLYPNDFEDGDTVLMNGSFHKFNKYLNKHPIDPNDPILKDCTIIKPCLNEG